MEKAERFPSNGKILLMIQIVSANQLALTAFKLQYQLAVRFISFQEFYSGVKTRIQLVLSKEQQLARYELREKF